MNINQFAIVILSSLFLFVFLSGFFLRRFGKPFHFFVLTIHKFLSLATIFYLSSIFYQVPLNKLDISLLAVTGIIFIGAIITGGLLSTNKTMPAIVFKLHQISSYLCVVFTAAVLFVVFNGIG